MKSNNPPVVATWLLKLFTVDSANDPLVGDLIEEYRRGRSGFWLWRQTLAAIAAGLLKALRVHPLAPVFALFWTLPMALVGFLVVQPMQIAIFLGHPWGPASAYLTEIQVGFGIVWRMIYLWLGIAIYVSFSSLIARRFDLRQFWRGSLVGTVLSLVVLAAWLTAFQAPSHSEPVYMPEPIYTLKTQTFAIMINLSTFLRHVPLFVAMALAILASLPPRIPGDRGVAI
jgi:hypothetical protein